MCTEYDLQDFGGDIQAFIEACYQAYLDFWNSSPTFQTKHVQRGKKIVEGKETTFWGIVEGHDDKEIDILRYKKVPLLGHVINETNITAKTDVLFFKRLHNRKIRIEAFSQQNQFLVVLEEKGQQSNKIQFITAHPLSDRQLQKKLRKYNEFVRGGEKPL